MITPHRARARARVPSAAQVGTLCAYGDRNTPTAAIVGSSAPVGIVANLAIATLFLGEPLRLRDVIGTTFVVVGVLFIALFCPFNPEVERPHTDRPPSRA